MFTDSQNVFFFTDERSSDEVNALFATENQVSFVFFSQCWQFDRNAWQVNTFVFAQVAVVQYFTNNFSVSSRDNFHTDQTVVNQNSVTSFQVFSETSVSYSYAIFVTNYSCIGSESKGLTCNQRYVVTAFQFDSTDFRAFGIQQDSYFLTSISTDFTYSLETTTVLFEVTVREVQAHYVHACFNHFSHYFFWLRLRTDGTYDLSFFHGRKTPIVQGYKTAIKNLCRIIQGIMTI